ncbi:MAG TPA: MFS transporter [Pseudonocardiaceae bacterium]|nr:MFS transporter [Pseudonocardiaceae bacterium]
MLSLLALVLVLSMSTWFSASAVIGQLAARWSLSGAAASGLTIAVQVGFAIGALVSGVLTLPDLIPARTLIFAGSAGAAAANAMLLVADSAVTGIAMRVLTGFFLALVYPPTIKLTSTWFVAGRGLAVGVLLGGFTIGSALPHLLNAAGGLHWQTVIVATSLLTLAGGIVSRTLITEGPYAFPAATFDIRQLRRIIANRGVRFASFGYFGHMWELYAMWTWFQVFYASATQHGGRSQPMQASSQFVTFATIGLGAVGCWLGGYLSDRWGRGNTTILMMAVSGTCSVLICLAFHGPIWLVLAISAVWGVSVVGDSAQFSALVVELGDQTYVGTAVTLQLACGFLLTIPTIWLIPILQRLAGSWQWVFLLLLPGPILGIMSMLRLRSLSPATSTVSSTTTTAEANWAQS